MKPQEHRGKNRHSMHDAYLGFRASALKIEFP